MKPGFGLQRTTSWLSGDPPAVEVDSQTPEVWILMEFAENIGGFKRGRALLYLNFVTYCFFGLRRLTASLFTCFDWNQAAGGLEGKSHKMWCLPRLCAYCLPFFFFQLHESKSLIQTPSMWFTFEACWICFPLQKMTRAHYGTTAVSLQRFDCRFKLYVQLIISRFCVLRTAKVTRLFIPAYYCAFDTETGSCSCLWTVA